jgi:hypothetical protein
MKLYKKIRFSAQIAHRKLQVWDLSFLQLVFIGHCQTTQSSPYNICTRYDAFHCGWAAAHTSKRLKPVSLKQQAEVDISNLSREVSRVANDICGQILCGKSTGLIHIQCPSLKLHNILMNNINLWRYTSENSITMYHRTQNKTIHDQHYKIQPLPNKTDSQASSIHVRHTQTSRPYNSGLKYWLLLAISII